jgi:hypothetical protein
VNLFDDVDMEQLEQLAPGTAINGARPLPPPAPSVETDHEQARRRNELLAEGDRAKKRETLLSEETLRRQVRQEADAQAEAERAANRRLRLTPASAFRVKPVRWVWAGRMPVGEITLIPGREGAGKSTFLAWQAAAITRGTLEGMFHGEPRSVLYAATEDSWEYTIAPRMIAAGADMARVFRIDVEHVELTTQAGTGAQVRTVRHSKLSLPVDVRLIPEAAREVGAAVLMCDPVISVIDDKINTFKAQELRSALEPLKRVVEEAGIALAGLVHFNKSKDTDILSMISGSRAWPEVARAVIAVAVDKDADEYTCVVSQVKNNLGRSDLPHLKYTIDDYVIRPADHEVAEEDVHIGRLRWTGESDRGAEEILQAKPEAVATSETTQEVMAFVRQRAAAQGGPVPLAALAGKFVGDDMTAGALKKILERAIGRGELTRPSRGMYLPAAGAPRPCPQCGKDLRTGENFCGPCSRALDVDDRRSRTDDGGLFPVPR